MSASVAFLTRLSLIAGESASNEACASHATALVHAYETVLYARLGMARSSRPAARAKEIAREALEDLRRRVLEAELGAPADAAVFAVARDRIEMARRALALRVTAEDGGADVSVRRREDRRRLDAIEAGLLDRRTIVTSRKTIAQSHELLGALRGLVPAP